MFAIELFFTMICVSTWLMFTVVATSKAQKILNYYQGVEDPGLGDSHVNVPKEQYFVQKLDHFDRTDHRTWLQRYWVNKSKHYDNGPAFLMINGEGSASGLWMTMGAWHDYCNVSIPIFFLLEHRYYGLSRPTNNTSTENLVNLNSQQALADVANFIGAMKTQQNLSENVKWIVFGGSYAGSLTAWARLKYPHLVYGAVSSSAPLLAKMDFFEYYQQVRLSIAAHSSKCEKEITRANKQLYITMKTKHGRSSISKWLNLCEELSDDKYDASFLIHILANNFGNLVQYDKSYKSAGGMNTIRNVCNLLVAGDLSNETSALRRYLEVHQRLLNVSDGECISSVHDTHIKNMQKIDWETSNTYGRPWMYQKCTELGFYQTSSTVEDMFGPNLTLEYYANQCKEVFGKQFTALLLEDGIHRTNMIYGAEDVNVGNFVYVHGSLDPWPALNMANITFESIFINGTSHCADMYSSANTDSQELQNARAEIKNFINSWLKMP